EESGYLRGREIEYVARIAIDSQFRVPAGLELQQGELDIVPKSVGQTDPLDRIEGRGTRKELTGILHHQRVYPGTTVNADIVLIVNDYIISAACRNRIGTSAAIDEIVACIATDRVVSVRSQHVVAPGTAIDEFGRGGADMDLVVGGGIDKMLRIGRAIREECRGGLPQFLPRQALPGRPEKTAQCENANRHVPLDDNIYIQAIGFAPSV